MLFEFGFYSSLLLIPFVHGVLYALLLFWKGFRLQIQSNIWLGVFLILCSLYIAPWMLGFAGWYDHQPYRDILFYVPFQQLLLMGPLLYFYTQSLLNPAFRLNHRLLLHFVPGLLYLIYMVSLWAYDYFIYKGYYFYADQSDKDFDSWYQYLGLASMVYYLILSIRFYNAYKNLIFHYTSYAESILFRWIKNYLIAFLLMLLLPMVFDLIGVFYPEMKTYTGSWWFFLCFSLITFYIALSGYSNSVQTTIPFQLPSVGQHAILVLSESNLDAPAVIETEVDSEKKNTFEVESWKAKIEKLLTEEKLYENPELTLSDIAKQLQTNASVVSKAINQGFEMNFNDLINHYRVEAVKKMLQQGAQKKSTLLGIAYDCGFNSKATFNRAFKKNTGVSPKEYCSGS
ncbi:helix-turn-helix transcriptional regulator [Flavobacterium sp. CYK-4]|uniref:helix-turn-helix domain-containing protein n=1 Tax=Flavobacterium lotistagni TaxID=2709660 RepID=UPI00140C3449|nr:helix-turn-helix transcriptional regulator [Flavobacterium lotistagni]NHM05984.1 helix-turn-helix transcriptional regulator [Flavobacterium lotistagni]